MNRVTSYKLKFFKKKIISKLKQLQLIESWTYNKFINIWPKKEGGERNIKLRFVVHTFKTKNAISSISSQYHPFTFYSSSPRPPFFQPFPLHHFHTSTSPPLPPSSRRRSLRRQVLDSFAFLFITSWDVIMKNLRD